MSASTRDLANLDAARQYLAAIASGATGDSLARFFAPDVVQEELPNRVVPDGKRRKLAAILEGAERGQRVLTGQRFEIRSAISTGDRVILEVLWVGTLAIPFGTIPAGGEMRAHSAMFLEFHDGKIVAQRNYDCFEPW
ncbi:MAG TPA: nuclear transport factor 2 family protein [Thermoanaerobaculia bacterium]|nr:nuclear transport factor 2 family protein [Thermoanaerobaculia bacterium]